MRQSSALLVSALMLVALPAAAADTYVIDGNHTQVRFGYSHFGFSSIEGIFSGVSGEISYDAADPSKSSVNVEIDLAQIQTGVAKLDEHLKSPDFFDLAKFPKATFRSTKVSGAPGSNMEIEGVLTVRDQKKVVTLNMWINRIEKHPMSGKPTLGANATATVKRTDLGVDKYAPNVSDDVSIEITVEANAAG